MPSVEIIYEGIPSTELVPDSADLNVLGFLGTPVIEIVNGIKGDKGDPGSGGSGAGTAINGTSIDGSGNVILGQPIGAGGDPGQLVEDTEIPMKGKKLIFQGASQMFELKEDANKFYLKFGDFNQSAQLWYDNPSGEIQFPSPIRLFNAVLADGTRIVIGYVPADFVASENIPGYNAVIAGGFNADSNNIAHRNKVVGISISAILNGFADKIAASGEVEYPGWSWAVGDRIFVNGTTLSNIAPLTGWSQEVGIAVAPTIVIVNLKQSFLL